MIILFIAYISSIERSSIKWRLVLQIMLLQIVLCIICMYFDYGRNAIQYIANGILHITELGQNGLNFVFGGLASNKFGFIFFIILFNIIFYSALTNFLYYIKVIPLFIKYFGFIVSKITGTTRIEGMFATTNIFLDQSGTPIVVKPFVKYMSRSQLFALATGGMASVAGNVFAAYIGLGVEAKYLIIASVMSAPGGLLMSKIICPDNTKDKEIQKKSKSIYLPQHHSTIIDAIASGAYDGLQIALGISAMIIAYLGVINFLDYTFSAIFTITITDILSYIFTPVAYILGIEWGDSQLIGGLIAKKVIFNEFIAYMDLSSMKAQLSQNSITIATFALCGFANIGSIGIASGVLRVIAPEKLKLISPLLPRVVLAGTLSNLMSAAIIGALLTYLH